MLQRTMASFPAALQLPLASISPASNTAMRPSDLPAGGLLADVSTLLADAQGVRSRLLQAGPAPAAEDDGIFIDDHAEVASR